MVCESTELRGKRGVDDIVWIGFYVGCEGCGKPVLKARLAEYMFTVWETIWGISKRVRKKKDTDMKGAHRCIVHTSQLTMSSSFEGPIDYISLLGVS